MLHIRAQAASLFFLCGILILALQGQRALAATEESIAAFSKFVEAGNYQDANFYLTNNLIAPAEIDTSQLFFSVVMKQFSNDLQKSAGQIDVLYKYLNEIQAIDLNRQVNCGGGYNETSICLFVNNMLTGADRNAINYFVERGMNLNQRVPGIVPSTVPLFLRLGTKYSLDDVNFFVSKGLVLGDELYPISELASYRDRYLYSDQLQMPDNYLSLSDQNFLDLLVVALGTRTDDDDPHQSVRRKNLCDFITYAAPSFTPSFDYLLYILNSVNDFRGANIGQMKRYSNNFFQPFPPSCVSLIQSMAASHSHLDTVISRFAGSEDVDTARWLISIRNNLK
jgi:hypothetical protein